MRFLTLLLFMATPAYSQIQNCGPRDMVVERLEGEYKERRRSIGLTSNNALIETFASDDGSWTIIITAPNGISCLAANGSFYEAVDDPTDPPGVDG